MKKLLPLFCFLFVSVLAHSQRDLQVKYYLPKYGDTIYLNESYTTAYGIINKGTADVPATDSIFLRLKINGSYVLGAFDNRLIPHGVLKPGDSLYFTSNSIITNFNPGPLLECFEVVISYNGVILDSVSANNEGCVLLNVRNRNTQGIENPTDNKIDIYPNPASDYLQINTGELSEGTAVLKDITGREVLREQISNGSTHINTSGLRAGVYFCTVYNNDYFPIATQKVTISR